MGTGSAGSGGGGGGGTARGGGGSYGSGGGISLGFSFSSKGVNEPDIDLEKAKQVVSNTLSDLPKKYVELQFANPFLDKIYSEIFFLKQNLLVNKSWDHFSREFGISAENGCLNNWVEKMVASIEKYELEQKTKVVETAQMALEDFCIQAVSDDIDTFLYGNSDSVIKAALKNVKFFNSIAGYFLSFLIWRVVEREKETLPPNVELRIHEACEQMANSIVASFEHKFLHKKLDEVDMVTHENLFFTFAKQTDWLINNFKIWAK